MATQTNQWDVQVGDRIRLSEEGKQKNHAGLPERGIVTSIKNAADDPLVVEINGRITLGIKWFFILYEEDR